ncbi:hypothetical protein ACFLWM_02555 [Chloroflexota bacterium]
MAAAIPVSVEDPLPSLSIVVAQSEGIEDTVHTLKGYINESFRIPKDNILELHGYAYELDEAKNNPQLVERAQEFGEKLVESLRN